MAKRGLPTSVSMRHDSHYVEELARANRSIGRIIPINQIEPNPEQPRVEIGDLTELTSSIKEKGVLEPLLVKPVREKGSWMIIAGERRWRAANLAGLQEVPCIELDIDEKSIAEIALIENLQRKDLTVWEEADGLADLANRYGYTHDEIAKKIGKSRSTVTEAMAIAGLPAEVRRKCLDAKISSKSTLLELSRQFDEDSMHRLLDEIQTKNLKRQEIRQTTRPQTFKTNPKPSFETKDFSSNDRIRHEHSSGLSQEISQIKQSNNVKNDAPALNQKTIFNFTTTNKKFTIEIKAEASARFGDEELIKALNEAINNL